MTIEDRGGVCIAKNLLVVLEVDVSLISQLGKCVEVEDVLTAGDQIVQCEVRSNTCEVTVVYRVAGVRRCQGDHIVLILPVCGVELWEVVEFHVEEDFVEDDLTKEYHRSLFKPRPPRHETKEHLLSFISHLYIACL